MSKILRLLPNISDIVSGYSLNVQDVRTKNYEPRKKYIGTKRVTFKASNVVEIKRRFNVFQFFGLYLDLL